MCDTHYNTCNDIVKEVILLNIDEIVSGLILELRRGTLILLVLSRLEKPTYGYNLVNILERGGVPVEANTLYPLMRRLESQGLLKSEWETGSNKPRKYYVLTDNGKEVLRRMKAHWQDFSNNVSKIMEANEDE